MKVWNLIPVHTVCDIGDDVFHNSANKFCLPKRLHKRVRGYTIAEFGPTLLLGLVIITFPLLAIGTLGTRYVFLVNAARLAAQSASRCSSFKADQLPNLSAVDTALAVSKSSVAGIGGTTVTWASTNTYIYVCPLGSTAVTTPGANTPLSAPADGVNNGYDCVVIINAQLAPVFPGFNNFIGAVPGLNAPFAASARGENFFENTGNLNL